MLNSLNIIILAGGQGKRMKSDLPKVLHKINDVPMIVKIIQTAQTLNPQKIMIVVGQYRDIIEKTIARYISVSSKCPIEYILQENALGTGHAIQCCRDALFEMELELSTEQTTKTNVLILSGDVPLISSQTLISIIEKMETQDYKAAIMTTRLENPYGYGRIISEKDRFKSIVEEKECNLEERLQNRVNAGIYVFDRMLLCRYVLNITNNNSQKEYYLTDIFEIITKFEDISILLFDVALEQQYEIMGVNTPEQLYDLSQKII